MNIRKFIQSTGMLLRVTDRPTRKELWLMIRISFLGIAIIGLLGFIIRVLFWVVGLRGTA